MYLGRDKIGEHGTNLSEGPTRCIANSAHASGEPSVTGCQCPLLQFMVIFSVVHVLQSYAYTVAAKVLTQSTCSSSDIRPILTDPRVYLAIRAPWFEYEQNCIQYSRLNLSQFLKMVMPNQHSQRLESIFLCTTQATPTGQ